MDSFRSDAKERIEDTLNVMMSVCPNLKVILASSLQLVQLPLLDKHVEIIENLLLTCNLVARPSNNGT